MAEEQTKPAEADYRFLTLVMSLSAAAWTQLGKIAHPVTQKVERDLEQAKMTIDFLRMLLEKTEGNRTPKEDELLSNTVSDLELNFADEMSKPKDAPEKKVPDLIIPSAASQGPGLIKP